VKKFVQVFGKHEGFMRPFLDADYLLSLPNHHKHSFASVDQFRDENGCVQKGFSFGIIKSLGTRLTLVEAMMKNRKDSSDLQSTPESFRCSFENLD
jgi:hypothetical protein